jgi:hypothetical protein
MSAARPLTTTAAVVAAVVVAGAPVCGQGLADRIGAMETGVARVTYATREGVEICDRGMNFVSNGTTRRGRSGIGSACRTGTAEAELAIRDGVVRDIEVLELDDLATAGVVDLGLVDAGEAARYFLTLARGSDAQPALEDAVFAAAIADVEGLWRDLMAIARDGRFDSDVRGQAIFWLGQDAAAAASAGIAELASDEREDQEVRDAAVFALSQRPAVEGVPLLMEIARSAEEGETRRSAMFWLAQSNDERVLAFFEEILLGRAPR